MKTATQNLERDHDHILRLTDAMERMARSGNPEIPHLESVVNIIRNYADGLHHAKEENLLFPKMAEKGFPVQGGPVGVMLFEHEQGRTFVKGMAENIEAFKKGDVGVLQKVFDNMLGYAKLLRNHIFKENNILFRMADGALSDEEQHELIEKFEKTESKYSAGKLDDFISEIDKLSQIYSE